jgi:hypothetical protein
LTEEDRFNCWFVSSNGAQYFTSATPFDKLFGEILNDAPTMQDMNDISTDRFVSSFAWGCALGEDERLLQDALDR